MAVAVRAGETSGPERERPDEAPEPPRALAEGPELVRLMGDDPDGIILDDDPQDRPARAA